MRKTKYKAWDGKIMHTVSELIWTQGGLKFYGPGVGEGIIEANPEFDWKVNAVLIQFTGLLDKSDKEIYEGYIVEIDGGANPIKTKVFFENGCFCVNMMGNSCELKYYINMPFCVTEIVGNIYENLEILQNAETQNRP